MTEPDERPPTGAGHDPEGLKRKYIVDRVDGRDKAGQPHHGCFLFVLDIDHDPAALAAVLAYAVAVKDSRPQLSKELMAEWKERSWWTDDWTPHDDMSGADYDG